MHRQMTFLAAALVAPLMASAVWNAPLVAQKERAVVSMECGSVDEILRRVRVAASERRALGPCLFSKMSGTVPATPGELGGLVDGLERLARMDADSLVRHAAAVVLAQGLEREDRPEGLTTGRLLRLYRDVGDRHARMGLFSGLGRAIDNHRVLPLAAELAIQPDGEEDFIGAAMMAVHALARMGEEGRAVLARLYQEGAVRSFHARAAIHRIAENDFRPLPPQ